MGASCLSAADAGRPDRPRAPRRRATATRL